VAHARDSLLWAAAHRAARPDGMGAGLLHLRRQCRRRPGEAPVRPLLHQAHVPRSRPLHPCEDREDRRWRERRGMTVAAAASGSPVNAMTIDVEDYFHVSV